jgi:N utilization substance protein B
MAMRRQAREWAVQFLFQQDFNGGDLERALADFWREKQTTPDLRRFAEELVRGALEHLPELDAKLGAYAENWDLKRMNAVDRNVLRLALFEMLHRPDIPPVVSINEAVEVAKRFSSLESGRFVNGILDRARKDLDRPSRVAVAGKP